MMLHAKKLGYEGFAMSRNYKTLRDTYPQAYGAFEKELENL